ncbi:16S rRNA (guanine(966)-N(2))-methyltransferase RsmD [Thiotrichales bacterium 19S3-7]|nr:16S rRNA (guanine(966)-N(2))-methyltransferase RsmD [Thiotrichales bacterium 19S3-7]MCF6801265.1 16S rRNA (guanine(966)-N(2))-methyltransferase RsmD [Thiotrichales bacterium 19S3-11]
MKNQILRIIGGKWRSRKLSFPSNIQQLRPTSDRIRETVFNWLSHDIIDSDCLDVFAGSGALGIEALSRGASSCTFIEKAKLAYIQLKKNLTMLDAENSTCLSGDALKLLSKLDHRYDLIFLDPPFSAELLPELVTLILQNQLLKQNGLIYFEMDAKTKLDLILENKKLQLTKHKVSGNVCYGLLKFN